MLISLSHITDFKVIKLGAYMKICNNLATNDLLVMGHMPKVS